MLGFALSNSLPKKSSSHVLETLKKIGNGVLIPLLFATTGLKFGWDFLQQDLFILITLALLLIPYRTIMHYLVLKTLRVRHARQISTSLLARGGVDLVVLSALLQREFIGAVIHSLTMVVSIASLLVYSLSFKRLYGNLISDR